jgi:hypothetical protein
LQRSLSELHKQQLGLAAISYDSVETLRAFTDKHGITFPLLSDAGSKTIDAWGLRNHEATGRAVGVPHPGTFVIDPAGRIVNRSFEAAYQERETAASILTAPDAGSANRTGTVQVVGKYLRAAVSASDTVAAPGQRLRLIVDVTPGPNIHVYAPGQQGYLPIELKLAATADFKAAAARFPPSREYVFVPLNERVQVFDRPFRIVQDVTLALTPAFRQRAATKATLTISGTLDYQACDDKVCFKPESLALTWSLGLRPIER